MNQNFLRLPAIVLGWLFSSVAPSPAKSEDSYSIYKRWPISDGEEGKLIVISPEAATESGLKKLGDQLRADTQSESNAFILVFTDAKAAGLRSLTLHKDRKKREFFSRHYVARYIRNERSSVHEMELFPSGFGGPSTIIAY